MEQEKISAVREICPRLYFLSDYDINELLTKPETLSEHVHKVMNYPKGRLHIVDNGVHALHSGQEDLGEKLALDEPVPIEGVAETLNHLIKASHQAVRREIEKAVKMEGSVLDLVYSDCIYQAIEVADCIRNTSETEEARNGGLDSLKAYLEKLNAKLEILSLEQKKELSPTKRRYIFGLLTLNVSHRNFVKDNLIAEAEKFGFPLGFDQEWSQSMRFYWNDGVQVLSDAYELDYDYEYFGAIERLVVTPLSRQAYKEYSRALYQGLGVTAQGPAGTGKTETARDFNRHLGRF